MKGELIMFINYKKMYKRLVNYVKALWAIRKSNKWMANKESEDINNYYDGYHDTLNDFYNGCLSKYIEYDKTHNIKIINYKKRYLDIVKRINNLYDQAIDEHKFYESNNEYINGVLDCVRDLLAIIIVISQ